LFTYHQKKEVERLLKLGATRVDWRYDPEADYVMLADPGGNTFCIVQVHACLDEGKLVQTTAQPR
jgi:hypothetical protein